jgi:hypothetical protein
MQITHADDMGGAKAVREMSALHGGRRFKRIIRVSL